MQTNEPFTRAQEEYYRLKGRLAAGRITRAEFEAALNALRVRDAQGRYWTLDANTARWLMHDGQKWIEATPPTEAGPPTTLPEQFARAQAAPAPARGANKLLLALGGIAIVCIIIVLALILLVNPNNLTTALVPTANLVPTPLPSSASTPTPALASSNVSGVKVAVVAVASPVPIAAKDFAALNALLAEKIALLNQAELKFIRDLRASSSNGKTAGLAFPLMQKNSALTDQDIKDIAGKAMDVAILAEDLGNMAGKQDKGSKTAAQSANSYYNIARTAWSLVADSQTIRQVLQPFQNGSKPVTQAIDTIASYGLQLWNSEVTDGNTKGNPFAAQTKSGVEAPTTLNSNGSTLVRSQSNANDSSVWIASSSSPLTRTLNIPAAQSPVTNPFDPQLLNSMTTADGQNDGNKAQQVAASNLQRLGATTNSTDPSKPSQVQVPSSSVAVSEGDQVKAGNLPTFKAGKATVISKNNSPDDNTFMNSFGLNGDQPPNDEGKTNVQDAPALVSLSLTNITIDNVNKRAPGSGSFEADVNFSFTVNWSTTLAAPQFKLNCNSHTEATLTQASGTLAQKANGLMIIYPGTITVYCYANSENGQALGSTSVNVLVGDADQATTRAQQVETDSANLNATLTADAQGTTNTQNTQAAGTAFVLATQNALETEVLGTQTAEFKLTASAFETRQALPPPATSTPSVTPTFKPVVVDQVFHRGDEMSVNTKVVLQRGRLYRFTFSGLVNLINPTRSVTANQLPEHVNGVAVPASGIVVIEGTGSVATITCSSGEPDPNNPGGYSITVEDLGPS